MKPLLLIDVDGVLNPDLTNSQARRAGFVRRHALGYALWVSTAHGDWLRGMRDLYELVWATTWMDRANLYISPLVGLPHLPVIEFDFDADGPTKIPGILRYVGDRPFAWLDDEVSTGQERLLDASHDRHLLIRVDSRTGLLPEHIAAAREWAAPHTVET